jgi:hypothetical protein
MNYNNHKDNRIDKNSKIFNSILTYNRKQSRTDSVKSTSISNTTTLSDKSFIYQPNNNISDKNLIYPQNNYL